MLIVVVVVVVVVAVFVCWWCCADIHNTTKKEHDHNNNNNNSNLLRIARLNRRRRCPHACARQPQVVPPEERRGVGVRRRLASGPQPQVALQVLPNGLHRCAQTNRAAHSWGETREWVQYTSCGSIWMGRVRGNTNGCLLSFLVRSSRFTAVHNPSRAPRACCSQNALPRGNCGGRGGPVLRCAPLLHCFLCMVPVSGGVEIRGPSTGRSFSLP